MTSLVSNSSSGGLSNNTSKASDISSDGRYIVFDSFGSNLVSGDSNGSKDIFLKDTATGTTTRLSVGVAGGQANGSSFNPQISADGRYVVFESDATNLVAGDTNGRMDIFLLDRQTSTVSLVSNAAMGGQANRDSSKATISADGKFVAFISEASNLVANDTNAHVDIFLKDIQSGLTTRISVNSSGGQANGWSDDVSLSADGHYATFWSSASNLVADDTNGSGDVFLYNRLASTTSRVSVNSAGDQSAVGSGKISDISADGHYITFTTAADNFATGLTSGYDNVYVHDTQTGAVELVSANWTGGESDGSSGKARISADGRYVAYMSLATDLVSDDGNGTPDIFVHDRNTGTVSRISVNDAGDDGLGRSDTPAISANGGYVTYASTADNLVAGDTNTHEDIFVTADVRFSSSADTVSLLDLTSFGISAGETVDALAGDDRITGSSGDDIIDGNSGSDIIVGGTGNDSLDGGSIIATEIDYLYGGIGDDTYMVNSTAAALDIVYEGGAYAGGASDVDTIISEGAYFWDFYNVGEVLTIDASAGANTQFISGTGDSTMNGNDEANILMAYGGTNEINPGKGIDTIGLSLYGLAASFNGTNTVKLKPGDDVNYIYDFESGIDKIDTSAYGRFADGAQMLANVVDTAWGSFVWMGVHEGQNEYLAIADQQKIDFDAGDFLV